MIFRRRIWDILEPAKEGDTVSRFFDFFMLSLILLNIIAVIAGSVESVQNQWNTFLAAFEVVSVAVFTVEYLARLWSCTADDRYSGCIRGRIRLAFQILSIVDLVAILPFFCHSAELISVP